MVTRRTKLTKADVAKAIVQEAQTRELTAGEIRVNAGAVARGTLERMARHPVDVEAVKAEARTFAYDHALELAYELRDTAYRARPICDHLSVMLKPIGPYSYGVAQTIAQQAIVEAFISMSEATLDRALKE